MLGKSLAGPWQAATCRLRMVEAGFVGLPSPVQVPLGGLLLLGLSARFFQLFNGKFFSVYQVEYQLNVSVNPSTKSC